MSILYEVQVEGYLDPCWSDWLDGMAITSLDSGDSLLTGALPDQSALHGLLNRIRDLNLKLIRVEKLEKQEYKNSSSRNC